MECALAWLIDDMLKITVFSRRDARVQTADGKTFVVAGVPCTIDVDMANLTGVWEHGDNPEVKRVRILPGARPGLIPELEATVLREIVLLAREFLESPEAEQLFQQSERIRVMLVEGCTPEDIISVENERDLLNEQLRMKRDRYRELTGKG